MTIHMSIIATKLPVIDKIFHIEYEVDTDTYAHGANTGTIRQFVVKLGCPP